MEQDLSLLQNISDTLKAEPEANQRILAENASISIGLMNAVLKRFVERGWIMLSNVNGRKLAYAITPKGINELYKRGKAFTAKNFELASRYNDILIANLNEAKSEGINKVLLYGNSYIKFLICYACKEVGVSFEEKTADEDLVPNTLCFFGELLDMEDQVRLESLGCKSIFSLVE